jgi:hypothetical protein
MKEINQLPNPKGAIMSTFMQTFGAAILYTFIVTLWVALPVALIAFAKTMRDWTIMEKELEKIQTYESV